MGGPPLDALVTAVILLARGAAHGGSTVLQYVPQYTAQLYNAALTHLSCSESFLPSLKTRIGVRSQVTLYSIVQQFRGKPSSKPHSVS